MNNYESNQIILDLEQLAEELRQKAKAERDSFGKYSCQNDLQYQFQAQGVDMAIEAIKKC